MMRSAIIILTLGFHLYSGQFFVSPNGDDGTNGRSIDSPLKTPHAAFSLMAAGDTVYLRDGIYKLSRQLKTVVSGSAGNLCKLWAYKGEKPVLDFAGLNDRGVYLNKDYWHIRGIVVRNAGSNGICVSGSGYHIIEGCVTHNNVLEGIKATNGSHDCLILNCDSYLNYDAANNGENADGFAAKAGVGKGIVFRGCRAWLNADDGWDVYHCPEDVLIDSCFAFRNGINLWGKSPWAGDGNAFKLGGGGDVAEVTVTRSVAFDNVNFGFDQNGSSTGKILYNCTGFRNGKSNFRFEKKPDAGTLKKHVLKNNISYQGGAPDIDVTAEQSNNSWQMMSVSASDFMSIDTSLALAPRNADYRLPDNGFFRLSSSSQLVDKGVDVGLPFAGSHPDLGAFEHGQAVFIHQTQRKVVASVRHYWDPYTGTLRIPARNSSPFQTIVISDLTGKSRTLQGINSSGNFIFNLREIAKGMYTFHLDRVNAGFQIVVQ